MLAVFPIASGDIRGDVHTLAERQPLDGLADPRIRLSVGLRGAPTRTAADLTTVTQESVIGAAVMVMPPFGRYDERQIANLGSALQAGGRRDQRGRGLAVPPQRCVLPRASEKDGAAAILAAGMPSRSN